jgi:type IV secretion system protein VirB11
MSQPSNDYLPTFDRAASVNYLLGFAKKWMDDPAITEVCVNRPGEVFCERQNVWERHEVPELTQAHLISLATAVAKYSSNDVSENRPILSAIMPGGERVQIVLPPACEHGTVSVTIRKPSFSVRTLADYEQQGFFEHIKPLKGDLTDQEKELNRLKEDGNYVEFLRRAVQLEKVIVVAGETGSGKTTFMKALMQEIPNDQRIITIEDVPELFLPSHPNHVHLFYPSEAKEEENSSDEANPHSACRVARRRNLRLHQRRGIRPWWKHYQLPRWLMCSYLRAAGFNGSAEPSRPHPSRRGDSTFAVSGG